jgi:signal transduction histidine kinase
MQVRKSSWVLLIRVGIFVGAAAALGLTFWSPLKSEERDHARRVTQGLARSVQTDIADEVRDQMLALVRLAKLLSFEDTPSQRVWELQARLLMSHYPGYLAIQWVDTTYRVRWVATSTGSDELQRTLAETDTPLRRSIEGMGNLSEAEAQFAPAFRLWNGDPGRRIVVPIDRDGIPSGFVVAVVDEQQLLGTILSDHSGLDYGIAVLEQGQEIYRMPGSSSRTEKAWAQDIEVHLPGATWHVRVWPQPKMLLDIGPDLSDIALLMGSLIGMLIFLTLDFARTSYFRLLDLRRTRDELEMRVAERTAELATEIIERKEAQESLQELSGRLLQLRDEEQRRIARELHDSTVQIMGAVAIDLEKIQQLVPDGDSRVQKLVTDGCELVERATTELRTMSYLLHPPILDDLGLDNALPWYSAGFTSRSAIQVSVDVQPGFGRLPRELELTIFRIVQEALTNVHRHSGSPTVEIKVVRDLRRVMLQIADQGRGMPLGTVELIRNGRAIVGVGIAGMRERLRQLGGSFEIESDDRGTLIRATLPLPEHESPGALQLSRKWPCGNELRNDSNE